ncbi:MAG: dephospho-CoA kinase [Pseudomonadota bacterium]
MSSGKTLNHPSGLYPNLFILGITGSIGAGKSTFASSLKKHGADVEDSDKVVHDFLSNNHQLIKQLADVFGHKILNQDGSINRAQLGKKVFEDCHQIKKLESYLHPLVKQARLQKMDALNQDLSSKNKWMVLDVPLLFETDTYQQCDFTILVWASEETRKKRVLMRPNGSEKRYQLIKNHQMPDIDKAQKADIVISSMQSIGSIEDLAAQMGLLMRERQDKSKILLKSELLKLIKQHILYLDKSKINS